MEAGLGGGHGCLLPSIGGGGLNPRGRVAEIRMSQQGVAYLVTDDGSGLGIVLHTSKEPRRHRHFEAAYVDDSRAVRRTIALEAKVLRIE